MQSIIEATFHVLSPASIMLNILYTRDTALAATALRRELLAVIPPDVSDAVPHLQEGC